MRVLVVGATGRNAGMVVPELVQRGVTVRALVRDEAKAEAALARGATETVVGNLEDPASLRTAADGVEGVFHINPAFAPNEASMGVAMVQAATAAAVRKFVFSSVLHPSISKMVNHAAKQSVEEALYESNMEYTVLQPAMFMQNLQGAWATVLEHGKITMPYSKKAKVCYVDYRDVAEAAALALTSDTLNHGTFELCAPGMVDRIKIAALMSQALGRTIDAGETLPEEAPAGPLREGLARMNAHYDQHGFPGGNALVLRAVLGREPRTLQEYIHELAHRA